MLANASNDYLERGREALRKQPFSLLLGVELLHWDEGSVELRLKIHSQLMQQNGFVHGGVIAYLADNALAFAGGGALGGAAVTSEMKVNFLRPAVGDYLLSRGWVVNATRRQAVTRCDVLLIAGEREQICAAAQGTISRLPERDASAS